MQKNSNGQRHFRAFSAAKRLSTYRGILFLFTFCKMRANNTTACNYSILATLKTSRQGLGFVYTLGYEVAFPSMLVTFLSNEMFERYVAEACVAQKWKLHLFSSSEERINLSTFISFCCLALMLQKDIFASSEQNEKKSHWEDNSTAFLDICTLRKGVRCKKDKNT